MMSEATFNSMVASGAFFVRDGDVYRPLAAGHNGRRIYSRSAVNGSYDMVDFTATGTDGPSVVPSPLSRPRNTSEEASITGFLNELDSSSFDVGAAGKSCLEALGVIIAVLLAMFVIGAIWGAVSHTLHLG